MITLILIQRTDIKLLAACIYWFHRMHALLYVICAHCFYHMYSVLIHVKGTGKGLTGGPGGPLSPLSPGSPFIPESPGSPGGPAGPSGPPGPCRARHTDSGQLTINYPLTPPINLYILLCALHLC